MSLSKVLTLSDGSKIPQIGLGTWLSKEHEAEHAVSIKHFSLNQTSDPFFFQVEFAVKNGYRHLDLALVYGNQEEIGRSLKKVIPSVVNREDLFITSKLWNSSHQPHLVEKELDETLKQLDIEYLDLYRE